MKKKNISRQWFITGAIRPLLLDQNSDTSIKDWNIKHFNITFKISYFLLKVAEMADNKKIYHMTAMLYR